MKLSKLINNSILYIDGVKHESYWRFWITFFDNVSFEWTYDNRYHFPSFNFEIGWIKS